MMVQAALQLEWRGRDWKNEVPAEDEATGTRALDAGD
jgi:hypothetical protein